MRRSLRLALTVFASLAILPSAAYAQASIKGFSPEALASDRSFIGVWSVDDRGDVPPRWTIAGPKNMLRQPRGVTLDPKNKTVIVSDKYLNGVLTHSFPELFETPRARETARVNLR